MCSRASSAKRSSPSRKVIHCPELCITPVLRARSDPLFSWWMTLNRTSCAAHWSHMALLASVEPSSTTINSTSVLFCLWRLERHSSRYAATLYTATITDSLYVYWPSLCMGILGIVVSSLFLILLTHQTTSYTQAATPAASRCDVCIRSSSLLRRCVMINVFHNTP